MSLKRIILQGSIFLAVVFLGMGIVWLAEDVELLASKAEAADSITIGDLDIGDKVADPSWEWEFRTGPEELDGEPYSGSGEVKPVTWEIAAKDHYSSDTAGRVEDNRAHVTLISEKLIGNYIFDDGVRSATFRNLHGTNNWEESGSSPASHGIRKFLNGSSYVGDDQNVYEQTFYDAMTPEFQDNILLTELPNKTFAAGTLYYTDDKIFLPSITELGADNHISTHLIGSHWGYYFLDSDRRAVGPEGIFHDYWTRTPEQGGGFHSEGGDRVRYICWSGSFMSCIYASAANYGVRPALNINAGTKVSATPNADGVYEVLPADPAPVPDPDYTVSITVSPPGSGTVSGDGTYGEGDSVTVTATAGAGYTFENWTEHGSVVSTQNVYTFSISGDRDLTANFQAVGDPAENTLDNLNIGDKVVDPSWEWEHRVGINYSNEDWEGDPVEPGETKPVTWIVVAEDHYGSDSGVTLLAEELVALFTFDDSTDRAIVNGFAYDGSNNWEKSGTTNANYGLRPWLNSSDIHSGEGFYREFPDQFKDYLVTVTLPNKKWEYGDAYTTEDNVFIPSATELGCTIHNDIEEIGTVYPYFDVAETELDARRAAVLGGNNEAYWSRTPVNTSPSSLRHVMAGGNFGLLWGAGNSAGVRPALNLRSDTPVSVTTNADGAYEIGKEVEPHAITVTAEPPDGGEVDGDGFYAEGEEVTISAEPAPLYGFLKWTENDQELSAADKVYSFPARSDHDFVAHCQNRLKMTAKSAEKWRKKAAC